MPLLLLYGVVTCAVAVTHFNAAPPPGVGVLMESRSKGINDSVAVLDRGGPPLLGCTGPYVDDAAATSERCFATGEGDDQGIYLYLPLVGTLVGEDDAALLVKWLFTWLMALVVLFYPLVWGTLFRSTAIGVLAPWPVIFGFDFLQSTDVDWMLGWAALLGLPLVFLAEARDRWNRPATGLLLAAVVVGGFATSIRSQAGLPVLVAAAIVVLLRRRRWRDRAVTIGALAGVYLAAASLPLLAAREYRDRSIGVNYSADALTAHPFWHPMYLGLGYLPNPYGIEWNDTVAFEAVERERPGTTYLSREYEETLRGLYVDIVRDDPGFVANTYGVKLRELLWGARDQFGLALLLIPAMLLRGPGVRRRRLFAALSVPALVMTALPPVLTQPGVEYGFHVGFLGVVGLLCMLGAAFAAAAAQRAMLSVGGADRDTHRARWSDGRARLRAGAGRVADVLERRPVALIAAGIVLGLAAIALTFWSQDAAPPRIDYEASATPLVRDTPLDGAPFASWDFRGALPAGWEVLAGVSAVPTTEGTDVTTTRGSSEYQLVSDPLTLEPGRYRIDLKGIVRDGGLELGALDTKTNTWMGTTHYWSGQSGFPSSLMALPLTLEAPAEVRLVLSNWNARRTSTWRIDALRLVRP